MSEASVHDLAVVDSPHLQKRTKGMQKICNYYTKSHFTVLVVTSYPSLTLG